MGPSRLDASNAVSIPAILLMVLSGLTILWSLTTLLHPTNPAQVDDILRNAPNMTPEGERVLRAMLGKGLQLLSVAFWAGLNGLVFFGALKMKNLQSYGLAMTSAILACVPCCGPCGCLGLIPGIWALVVLNKNEVKACFS
ncbi:hypothetical protein DRW03_12025 [Corallococcus sp. H22C18031201]|nr:hypothetical protein [Citreicoccus inhibens]RJS23339.1 hypothetical protein DRW03_12025 [Corallococcus sp. H22C18031201]